MTSPVPGPPKPGDIGRRFARPDGADAAPTVSPEVVAERVQELIAQVDEVRAAQRATDDDGPAIDLGVLERQAVLLEQAHQVLSVALEDVDRAT